MKDFITTYVFSIDHKTIAKQYLFTGLAMALLGGITALLMRIQLAYPGTEITFIGRVPPGFYNALVTNHGAIMVFWVAMPIMLGFFGNLLIPLMIGAPDMAFPRLNMLSYWTFFLSTVVLIISFFMPGGGATSGWTAYPPLSATGIPWAQATWLLAIALEFVSVLMGGINFMTTPLTMRAPGMDLFDMPILVWMEFVASFAFMLSVGPLIAGAVLLEMDLLFSTGFFLPEAGGDPLLWQHLFWFFGHPEVYVIFLPALGVVAEILPTFSRKTLFSYDMIVWSTFIAAVLSFIVWAHHQFVSGMDPRLAMPFGLFTILISVPFAVIIFSYIATLWRGDIQLTTPMLFSVGMIALFLVGGCTGIPLGAYASDIYMHDTYFVVAHFHFTLFPSIFLGGMAGIYYWWPKMLGRKLNQTLGQFHFWGTTIFFCLTFIPMFFVGIAGNQRRIYDPTQFEFLEGLQYLQEWSTMGVYGLLLSQGFFIAAILLSFFQSAEVKSNPWKATTLEWLAPPVPGHGNFETVPSVHRGPYEFNNPEHVEKDYWPQWEE